MKTKQTILKAFASLALALGAFAGADAQTNLGASCGCPAVGSRQPILLSSVAEYTEVPGTGGGKLSSKTLTCDKTWILDVKIYVDNGQTLTINPGTLIKGNEITNPANATALVIARGGKIMAQGTESCPIVFTSSLDPMNGTYAVSNTGKWGGVVLLGRATNNLTLAANGPFVPGGAGKLAIADGLGTVEGFASSYALDQYGAAQSTPVAYVSATSPNVQDNAYTFSQVASGAVSQNKITLTNNGSYVLSGMAVSGNANIPANTTVTNVSGNDVYLSNNLTAAISASNVTFTGIYPQAVNTAGLFYAGTAGTGVTNSSNVVLTASPFTLGNGPLVLTTFTNSSGVTSTAYVNFAAPFIGSIGASGFDDDDNSGIMTYVSIRHSGAILSVGAEINGLTLASVGRGTKIEHIEIVSCADDNIEVFGGTVNLKYITTLFGNDDMFDYDLGYKGKVQFFFGMKNTMGVGTPQAQSPDNDNGIEADSDDNYSNNLPKSHPIMYNFTLMGNGKVTPTSDNRSLSGANFKEQSEGELYNSIIVNFKNGINIVKTLANNRPFDCYDNWSLTPAATPTNPQSLKIKCNTIWQTGLTGQTSLGLNASSSSATATQVTGADLTQFTNDLNTVVTSIDGMNYNFTIGTNNAITAAQRNDVTPTTPISVAGCPAYPTDGFFEPVNYRGAFSSVNKDNWLSNWSYSHVLNATVGVRPCPTDLNADGQTDVNDFIIFAPAFGTVCQ
jgi:hypothetical protein